jgi:hypothetical protein
MDSDSSDALSVSSVPILDERWGSWGRFLRATALAVGRKVAQRQSYTVSLVSSRCCSGVLDDSRPIVIESSSPSSCGTADSCAVGFFRLEFGGRPSRQDEMAVFALVTVHVSTKIAHVLLARRESLEQP